MGFVLKDKVRHNFLQKIEQLKGKRHVRLTAAESFLSDLS